MAGSAFLHIADR